MHTRFIPMNLCEPPPVPCWVPRQPNYAGVTTCVIKPTALLKSWLQPDLAERLRTIRAAAMAREVVCDSEISTSVASILSSSNWPA